VKLYTVTISMVIVLAASTVLHADCTLDHLIIGYNRDGIMGTEDDMKLFLDCQQKYRHSGSADYANWFYPLHESIFSSYPYRLGEPGFDLFQISGAGGTYDPNRSLNGQPGLNYSIIVEIVSISPGLKVVHKEYPQFTLDRAGQSFNHSSIHESRGDPHMHLSYQAMDNFNLHWITYCVYDELADSGETNHYEASEPVTIVFVREPLAGDLVIDGTVDAKDLVQFGYYWLANEGDRSNDYYERADANRDGLVDFLDFTLLASNWLESFND
jgi:hypothetical protein